VAVSDSTDKIEATKVEFDEAKIEVTLEKDQVDAKIEPSENEMPSEIATGEVTNVEFDEKEIDVNVEKVETKEISNKDVELDNIVVSEKESPKEVSEPLEEVPVDTRSLPDSETSKTETSTPATLEVEENEPKEDKKEDTASVEGSKNDKNVDEKEPEKPETVESLQETLKRELTLKRKDEPSTNTENVSEPVVVHVEKKQKSKGCCILM